MNKKQKDALLIAIAFVGWPLLLAYAYALSPLYAVPVVLGVGYTFAVAFVAIATRYSARCDRLARSILQYDRRRPTDAGNWMAAPIAEIDKSTCGKLLASRLRREPGLHVVVRPEPPKVCTDALYDPEVDGDGGAR